jgi:outer membrane protein TolC
MAALTLAFVIPVTAFGQGKGPAPEGKPKAAKPVAPRAAAPRAAASRPVAARPVAGRPAAPAPRPATARKAVAAGTGPKLDKATGPVLKLTLKKALAMAMRMNFQLRSTRLGVRAAREGVKAAWGALGPHISVTADFLFQGGENAFSGGGGSSTSFFCEPGDTVCQNRLAVMLCGESVDCLAYLGTADGQSTATMIGNALGSSLGGFGSIGKIFLANTFKPAISLVWPLFNPAAYLGIKQAKLGVRVSRLTVTDTAQDVALKIRVAFYQILQFKELSALVEAKLKSSKAHLRQAKALLEAGSGTRTDILRWEAEVANDKLSHIKAVLGVAQLKILLNNLLGRRLNARVELIPPPEVKGRLPAPKGSGWDIEKHPQLKLAQASQKMKFLEYRMAQSKFLPMLTLTASYSWQRYIQYLNVVPDDWLGSWIVGLNLSIPIFDSMTDYYQVRSKKYELAQLRLKTINLRRALTHQLRSAALDLRSAREQVLAGKKQVELAVAAHKSTENLYKAGDARTTDLLDAQNKEIQAKGTLIRSRYDYLIALARLRRAAGKL